MKLDLSNIVTCLKRACQMVKGVENADLLICIGNTGCGKSTLLASLIHGPKSMMEEVIQSEIPGKSKTKKSTVITCSAPDNVFTIGHSNS